MYSDVRGREPIEIARDEVSMRALVDLHVAMLETLGHEGQEIRKVIPRDTLEQYLQSIDYKGAPTDEAKVGGFIGDKRNLEPLSTSESVRFLGLDYDGGSFLMPGEHGKQQAVPTIAVLDFEVKGGTRDELRAKAKVPMDAALIAEVKRMALAGDANAAKLLPHLQEQSLRYDDPHNPYTACGMSTSGDRMGTPREHLSINQELKAAPMAIPEGAKLKIKAPDGREVTIATYVVTETDGKRVGKFVLDPELHPELRATYEKVQARGELDSRVQVNRAWEKGKFGPPNSAEALRQRDEALGRLGARPTHQAPLEGALPEAPARARTDTTMTDASGTP